jgi:outer membrane protease
MRRIGKDFWKRREDRALKAASVMALLILLPSLARSQDARKAIELSTTTSLGLYYGSASEFIYNQAVSNNYKNSELFWPVQPLLYAGAGLSLAAQNGMNASLYLRQGFSGKTGTMTDSDFLRGDGLKTHYSESDGYTERAIIIDLSLGYDWPISRTASAGIYAGFSYMDFKWSARDGYYQYPASGSDYYFDSSGAFHPGTYAPWSAGETKTPIYGTGILYEQVHAIGLLGIKGSIGLSEALTLGASFSFAPLAYCLTEDNHEMRSVDFFSTVSGGFMVEPRLALSYALFRGASLELSAGYRLVSKLLGDITQVNGGVSSTSSQGNYFAGPDSASTASNASGASFSMFDAGLRFRLVF